MSLAVVLGWTFSTSPFHETNRHKAWPRIAIETSGRHLMHMLNARQMQWLRPKGTRETYEQCANEHQLPILIDELGSDGRLLWLGDRRSDKVILYVHGGCTKSLLSPVTLKPHCQAERSFIPYHRSRSISANMSRTS